MVDVLTMGECMVALRSRGLLHLGSTFDVSIAGAETNVAIGLSRLGHSTRWVGRVGSDESGRLVQRTLRAEGVMTDAVVSDASAPTGLIMFEQRLPDVTRVEYHRRGSAGSRLHVADLGPAIWRDAPRLLHITGITPAISTSASEAVHDAVAKARDAGANVSIDINHRAALWDRSSAAQALAPLARVADIVIASEDELDLVANAPEELLTYGAQSVVIKLGARGARSHVASGHQVVSQPAAQVTAVDSVGAGDAFCAGYLSAWLDGLPEQSKLARATAVAGFAVSTHGDWEGLPHRSEIGLIQAPTGSVSR